MTPDIDCAVRDGDLLLRSILRSARDDANKTRMRGWRDDEFARGQRHGQVIIVQNYLRHDPLLLRAVENELWFLRDYATRQV
jgi:hypothetical protein